MHKITEIREFSKAKSMIVFEDESFLVIYKGMYKGSEEEMTDGEYETLFSEMLSYGKKRAMNLLIKKDYSRKALTDKLGDDGFNPALIEKIIAFLDGYHYLDDERLAENLIRANKATKSMAEIKFLLKKREIPEEIAQIAMEEAYGSQDEKEYDPELRAIVNLLKKLNMTPEKIEALDYKEKQKLAAKFYRKGFRSGNISKALKMESFE